MNKSEPVKRIQVVCVIVIKIFFSNRIDYLLDNRNKCHNTLEMDVEPKRRTIVLHTVVDRSAFARFHEALSLPNSQFSQAVRGHSF